jgi:hypothetical protein
LHHLDALAVLDQQRGVVVAQVMELAPSGSAAALAAVRHTSEKRVRRIGRPALVVKMNAAGRRLEVGLLVVSSSSTGTAGNAARCAVSASRTTWGGLLH